MRCAQKKTGLKFWEDGYDVQLLADFLDFFKPFFKVAETNGFDLGEEMGVKEIQRWMMAET